MRARKVELNLAHRLVAQIRHQPRDDAVADDERDLPPLANRDAGLRTLHDDDVFGIAVAELVIDDGRRQMQASDLGVRIVEGLADERRNGDGRGGGGEKIVDLTAVPNQNRNEDREHDRKDPIAWQIRLQRRPQASDSAGIRLKSRLLKTRCTSSCSSSASRKASAAESAAPCGSTFVFARMP